MCKVLRGEEEEELHKNEDGLVLLLSGAHRSEGSGDGNSCNQGIYTQEIKGVDCRKASWRRRHLS